MEVLGEVAAEGNEERYISLGTAAASFALLPLPFKWFPDRSCARMCKHLSAVVAVVVVVVVAVVATTVASV